MTALLLSIHTWHDALLVIAIALVLAPLAVAIILARRVTMISLPKREVRFKQK